MRELIKICEVNRIMVSSFDICVVVVTKEEGNKNDVVENVLKETGCFEPLIEITVKMTGKAVVVFKVNDGVVVNSVTVVDSQAKLVENITKNVSIKDGVFIKYQIKWYKMRLTFSLSCINLS